MYVKTKELGPIGGRAPGMPPPRSANANHDLLLTLTDSTNNEIFTVPMSVLVDSIYGDQHNTIPLPGGIQAAAPTTPLPMTMLDSLTVHAKMRYSPCYLSTLHQLNTLFIDETTIMFIC